MKVCLIRHGATAGNLQKRYIGSTDEGLCPEGIAMLRLMIPPSCDSVFVSPMRRCLETASILYPTVQPIICENLRECDFGDFEGRNYEELNGDPAYQTWINSGGNAPFPGGESPEAFKKRSADAFCDLMRSAVGTCAFVVHGGTIMAVCEAFCGGTFYQYHVPNAGGFRAEWDGSRLTDPERL